MIELPLSPSPVSVEVQLLDFGYILRPATGAAILRVNRAGSRYRASIGYEPMTPDIARVFLSRLQQAKREGLRITYPLLGLSQGAPGSPVVDGNGQTGTVLNVTGLVPGYTAKEGYALTLVDSSDNRYLHFLTSTVVADASGDAALNLSVPLRGPLADGDSVLLAKPTMDGFLIDEIGWSLSVDQLIRGATIILEEPA